MKTAIVGIGEYHIGRESEIKTFALGSCVAVILFDTSQRLTAMMHVALPDSSVNAAKADRLPGYFADTGLELLLREMHRHGVRPPHPWIKIVGGASMLDPRNSFDIGKRNVLAIKKYLWKNRMGIAAEDVGGTESRSVKVSGDGEVVVSRNGVSWRL